ncbi:MAG: MBL fold metallo-hydrolase [Oculatellaceae cyanobacterium Prado106]|nr:MBL fold metallo-hydrolase [Oculatellaceae cyanobacterium Prado106]
MSSTASLILPVDSSLPVDSGSINFKQGSIFFVGTATVILRYAGLTLLTDPNFLHQGDHIHLEFGLTSTRLTNPAIEIDQLPPLDLVLLSHMHDDHFDHIASERLRKDLPIVTNPHAARSLHSQGFKVTTALNTWDSVQIKKGETQLNITAMPGRHGPGILAGILPPVMGSLLEFHTPEQQQPFRIYISGDTLVYDQLKEIPQRYPNIDLALIHLGGTQVFGIFLTMDAKQGVKAIQMINPHRVIPIHYNDYKVFKSPLGDFMQAAKAAGLEDRVHYLRHGETFNFETI